MPTAASRVTKAATESLIIAKTWLVVLVVRGEGQQATTGELKGKERCLGGGWRVGRFLMNAPLMYASEFGRKILSGSHYPTLRKILVITWQVQEIYMDPLHMISLYFNIKSVKTPLNYIGERNAFT